MIQKVLNSPLQLTSTINRLYRVPPMLRFHSVRIFIQLVWFHLLLIFASILARTFSSDENISQTFKTKYCKEFRSTLLVLTQFLEKIARDLNQQLNNSNCLTLIWVCVCEGGGGGGGVLLPPSWFSLKTQKR